MKCPNCNAILDVDAKFCTTCGTQLDATETPTEAPAADASQTAPVEEVTIPEGERDGKKKPKKKSEKPSGKKLQLLVGTALILVGFLRIFVSGTTISSTSFGGDFYTYTYQGIVAISQLLSAIETSLGWLIVAIGAAIDLHALERKE